MIICQVRTRFTKLLPGEFDLVGAVDDTVQDGIGYGKVTQIFMPGGDEWLACDSRTSPAGTVI